MQTDEPTYALQMVRPFWKLLRRYPQIPARVLEQLDAYGADRRIAVPPAQELLRAAVQITGEADLGLLAARNTQLGAFDVLEYAAASAPTWRAALETIFRYSRLMNEAADFRLEVHEGHAQVILDSKVPLVRAGIDFQNAALHVSAARWLEPASELQVWFSYERPDDISEHRRTFGQSRLRFGAPWSGFVFDARRLDEPLDSNDPALHRVLREHADHLLTELAPDDTLVARVRAQILGSLKDGPASAADVAAQMHVTRRTLTRRLRQHGTSFTELLEDVRRSTATHYLQLTDYTVEDIAFLLGFSESSAFVRAFKRWTGQAPLAYRRAYRTYVERRAG